VSIWILLWLALSAIILGASGWSSYILFRQKEAWRSLSEKHKLTYTGGRFMGPPSLEGFIDKYRISLFTAERQSPEVRNRRFVTVVEITLPEGLIDAGAAGTPEMVTFMEGLTNLSPMAVDTPKWDVKNRLFARSRSAMRLFLTEERMEHLIQLLATRNADIIVLFDDNQAIVRLETTDPILDATKAEKVIKRLILHADGLKISKQERADIKAKALNDEPEAEIVTPDVPAPEAPPSV
jgi:hypothetical protein